MVSKRPFERDKTLIAEQPGLAVLLGGLFLALALGGLFRSVFSPQRIKAALGTALAQARIDAQVKFSSATLSLSHRGLPRLSILIGNIVVDSKDPCLLGPNVTIDELELPISVSELIKGHFTVDHLRAGQVSVDLTMAPSQCGDWNKTAGPLLDHPAPAAASPQIAAAPAAPGPVQKSISFQVTDIKSLTVGQLQIKYLPQKNLEMKVANLLVELKKREPRVINVRGDLLFPKENFGIDYLSAAQLFVELTPDHTSSFVEGFLREGQYKWSVKYANAEGEVESDLQFKHIPLSQMYKIAKHRKSFDREFNMQQMWMSLNLRLKDKVANLKKARLNFSDLKLEGDLGDIESPQFYLEPLENPKVSPVDIQIKDLSVVKFFSFFGWAHPSPTLADLGHLTGQIHLESLKEILLLGEWRGLQMIFSNKGQREIQGIDSLKGYVKIKDEDVTGELSQVRMQDGSFKGSLVFNGNLGTQTGQLKALVDELVFKNEVQSLMTNQGNIGPLSGAVDVRYVKGSLKDFQGQLKCEDLTVEGVGMTNMQLNLETRDELHLLNLKAQSLNIPREAPVFEFLSPLSSHSDSSLLLKGFASQLNFKDFTALEWTGLQATLDRDKTKVVSSGGWNEHGDLHGELILKTQKQPVKWNIKGHREKPELERAR